VLTLERDATGWALFLPPLEREPLEQLLRSLAASPQVRQSGDFANVAPTQWRELHRRLERIEREHDAHRRTILIGDLDHWIESAVPALAAHLIAVRSLPGLDELIQGRNAVNPD